MRYNFYMENIPTSKQELGASEALGIMHGLLGQMNQLGRQDEEPAAAMALIEKVMRGEIDPKVGVEKMQQLLDSKQVH